jgi:hypothetical protein
MNPFETETIYLLKKTGQQLGPYKCILMGDSCSIDNETLDVDVGDTIIQMLPNGKKDNYLVLRANYRSEFHGIPGGFDLKLEKQQQIRRSPNNSANTTIIDKSRHQTFSGTATNSNFNFGDNSTLTNTVQQSQASDEIKQLLEQLLNEIKALNGKIPEQAIQILSEESETLITETSKEQPRKKYLGLSLEGIKEAALTLKEVGEPILELATKLSPLLLA